MADYLQIPEIASRLDVSDKTARKYVKTGELPSTYMGRSYRVSEEDLQAFIESRRVEGPKAPKAKRRASLDYLGEAKRQLANSSYGRGREYDRTAAMLGKACERLEAQFRGDKFTPESFRDFMAVAAGLAQTAEESTHAELRDLEEKHGAEHNLRAQRSVIAPAADRCAGLVFQAMRINPERYADPAGMKEALEELRAGLAEWNYATSR